MAEAGNVIVRFDTVSFGYGPNRPTLREASFVVRRGTKMTVMGQNGAGKSTLFSLITGARAPDEGDIHIAKGAKVAIARQVMPREELDLSIRDFFAKCFDRKVYDIDPRIDAVLEVVHLKAPHDRIVRSFSGGQQARLLLAAALIQEPDILLLDEPTNNLDRIGIEHLTELIKETKQTVIVISHDADFLNSFTQGVLYLDVHTHTVEQYTGNYKDVLKEISARIERENRKNAQLAKEIQEDKDKVNYFAQKGSKMRLVAKRMRDRIEELEEEKVDVRREDRTIRPFSIPCQEDLSGELIGLSSVSVIRDHVASTRTVDLSLRKNTHLLLAGPNGIGKSTLLESIASGKAPGMRLGANVKIGYYRQDFSNLDFDKNAYETLKEALPKEDEELIRKTAACFLITGPLVYTKIGNLSEGQKGLVAFARLTLERPGLLILDEPTNHINFRHIPVIAKALDQYEGAMILVSHVPEFVAQVRIDQTFDLGR